MERGYGFPAPLPFGVDFYTLTNEDIGFVANLVTGTNDNYVFYLPYPSSIDLFDETIVVWAIEFLYVGGPSPDVGTTAVNQSMAVYISMLNRSLTATFRGLLTDSEDEWIKAQFAGPMFFGENKFNVTAAAAAEGTERTSDSKVTSAIYHPPNPIDCIVPPVITLVNGAVTVTLATNGIAAANFTAFEAVGMRVWFTPRRLTAAERDVRNTAVRWQRLDA